jgi:RNA polymerase sigma factor (sigma-70 family)
VRRGAETEDGDLVRRVRGGDDRAFEQLYQRYHRRITGYIQGMVHDHARAEDVAQDVFVSALRRMRETDRPIAFKPWIYEIAKNACIDQFRRSRRAEEVSYDSDEGMGAADYGRMVSGDAAPESRLESKQRLEDLRGAFGGLSEAHHQILVMRELEGLSYREIGERLGMSRPSVESTLFRARRRLTEEYEELVSGARCQRIQAIIAGAETAVVGARDERRLARHVSHCQPCRRQARLAGLDVSGAGAPVRRRIAALLPLPLFLRRRWSAGGSDASATGTAHVSGFAQWSAQLGSTVDPNWIKAAATAATVAVAGVGAGVAVRTTTPMTPAGSLASIVSGLAGSDGAARPPARPRAPAGGPAAPAVRPTSATAAPTASGRAGNDADAATGSSRPAASTTASGPAAPAAGTRSGTDLGLDQVTPNLPPNGDGPQGGSGASPPPPPADTPSAPAPTSAHIGGPVSPPPATVPASTPDPASTVAGANQAAGDAADTVTTAAGLGGGG